MKILNCRTKGGTCTGFKWLRVVSDTKIPWDMALHITPEVSQRDSEHIKKDSIRRINLLTCLSVNSAVIVGLLFFFQFMTFSDFMGNEGHLPLTGPTFSDIISFSGPFSFCFFVYSSQQI
jgi:hypothetical protein